VYVSFVHLNYVVNQYDAEIQSVGGMCVCEIYIYIFFSSNNIGVQPWHMSKAQSGQGCCCLGGPVAIDEHFFIL
jgi:hypothetical protein